ncbi:MAG: uroporphyrinogen-III synthase [Planctomycetaceae bacterium]|jgi:uroporphyrinogen III methyltransferase/synthase|nr:uroporphyrinogen-III synthase [Planctomycetaceae bacterium]
MPIVLLTRPEHLVKPLQSELESLGWAVLLQPTITIRPPDSWVEVDDVIRRLLLENKKDSFNWLVFSSVNGIQFFFDRIWLLEYEKSEGDKTPFGITQEQLAFLRPIRIAVIGAETDAALQRRIGRRADILPEIFSAEGVLEHLLKEAKSRQRFLLLRANRGRDILRRHLEEAGGVVTEVVVYRSVDVEQPSPKIAEFMRKGKIDYTTVTSSSIASSLVRMFGEDLRQSGLISISPITTNTLCELGFPPRYEAKTASINGVLDVLKELSSTGQSSIFGLNFYNELIGRQHQ